MPKLVLKSELTENVELLTQIAEKLGFEVSVKEEKSKKKEKLKKGKSKEKDFYEFSKKVKSSKKVKVVADEDEDELDESENEIDEDVNPSEKLNKVKVKKSGKEGKKSKGYYDMDDDFMKDF
jgi:hypothetical protein